jgi:hypothetical protein
MSEYTSLKDLEKGMNRQLRLITSEDSNRLQKGGECTSGEACPSPDTALSPSVSFEADNLASGRPAIRSSSTNASSQHLLPWDRFSYWINSIMVVTFDIEMGQSIESIYPSVVHTKLTNNDKLNICYMCFPDSNSGFLGDTQFHFRFNFSPLLLNEVYFFDDRVRNKLKIDSLVFSKFFLMLRYLKNIQKLFLLQLYKIT